MTTQLIDHFVPSTLGLMTASSAISNATDLWTFSVTNLSAGRYDISGTESTAANIALVLATLVATLKAKGVLK